MAGEWTGEEQGAVSIAITNLFPIDIYILVLFIGYQFIIIMHYYGP